MPHDETAKYRERVEFIKKDPFSKGALIPTHKIAIFLSCADQFDYLDEHSTTMGEISCISKDGNKLLGHAKDPISSDLALNRILPEDYWKGKKREFLCLGAGGAAIRRLYISE
jgi:Shikimate 5-dehydrogenase